MSLFKELERLYRVDRFQREDFLTEIVAQVLRDSRELTFDWLHSLGLTDLKDGNVHVETQVTYHKLPGHEIDSRPDIVITLSGAEAKELLFIESKVDAKQGDTQLQRYADHLLAEKTEKRYSRVSLLFITHDYEKAVNPAPHDPVFRFQTTRWFAFYDKMKAHVKMNSDGLFRQLKLFMEENRMSLGNQFRSTDLVAMENISSALALIEETLEGEVAEGYRAIFGSADLLTGRDFHDQLRKYKRHILWSDLNNGFELCIGYYFPNESPDQPVWIGVELAAPITRLDVVQAFREWSSRRADVPWTLKEYAEVGWLGLRKGKTLHSIMNGEDHVRAAKDFLLQLLPETIEFKKRYPKLSWPRASDD